MQSRTQFRSKEGSFPGLGISSGKDNPLNLIKDRVNKISSSEIRSQRPGVITNGRKMSSTLEGTYDGFSGRL